MGLFGHLLTFGIGVYTGLFLSQNYDMVKVDEPSIVLDKIIKFIDDQTKPSK